MAGYELERGGDEAYAELATYGFHLLHPLEDLR